MTMDLSFKENILGIRHKKDADRIARMIFDQVNSIGELMDCFFSDDWVLCQRASWPIAVIADKQPWMLQPYIGQMIEKLNQPVHDAVIRNTVRAWAMMPIDPNFEGAVYERCFKYLANPKMPIAVRVFAMTVCTNIAERHPVLAAEVIPVIEDHFDHSSAGFRSRGMKELKRLNKFLA